MQKVDQNIPGAPYYAAGKHVPNGNNYLNSPPQISGSLSLAGWVSDTNAGFTSLIPEVYDHLHYMVLPASSVAPTKDQMRYASYIKGDQQSIVIPLPEGENNVYFLEHNETQHEKGYDTDIIVIGPLQIDLTPPVGSIQIAGGYVRITSPDTFLEVIANDDYSGVSGVYIDGDVVDGPTVRQWIPYSGSYSIELTPNFDRKYVNIRFMDYAGNESGLFIDEIFYGETKYFFYKVNDVVNEFKTKSAGFKSKSDNTFDSGGARFKEGAEYAQFGDN